MAALPGFVAVSELDSITDHVLDQVDGTTIQNIDNILSGNLTHLLAGLPTSDPDVAGAPWLHAGVLTVSAGS